MQSVVLLLLLAWCCCWPQQWGGPAAPLVAAAQQAVPVDCRSSSNIIARRDLILDATLTLSSTLFIYQPMVSTGAAAAGVTYAVAIVTRVAVSHTAGVSSSTLDSTLAGPGATWQFVASGTSSIGTNLGTVSSSASFWTSQCSGAADLVTTAQRNASIHGADNNLAPFLAVATSGGALSAGGLVNISSITGDWAWTFRNIAAGNMVISIYQTEVHGTAVCTSPPAPGSAGAPGIASFGADCQAGQEPFAAGKVCAAANCSAAGFIAGSATCNTTGQWTYTDCLPACTTSPVAPDAASHIASFDAGCTGGGPFSLNTTCNATCKQGWTTAGTTPQATCQGNSSSGGAWSVIQGCNVQVTCPGTPASMTGAVAFACSNNTFGAACSAACNTQAGFTGAGFSSSCTAAGSWGAPSGGGCSVTTCPGAPASMTGAVAFACSNNTFGAACSAACDTQSGFTGAGFSSSCTAAGSWSDPIGACSLVTCSGSPANQTGARNFACSNNTFGAVCSAACNTQAGFTGPGFNSSCTAAGNWSTPSGACAIQRCTALPPSTIAGQAGWPAACAGTEHCQSCAAPCATPLPGATGATAHCVGGTWLPAGGSCTPDQGALNATSSATTARFQLAVATAADALPLLSSLPCLLFDEAGGLSSLNTCDSVRVTVSSLQCSSITGGLLLQLLVEIINAKSEAAATLQLDSPATTQAVAHGLAAALAVAGRDVSARGPAAGSIAWQINPATGSVAEPQPIKVDCAAISLKPLADQTSFAPSQGNPATVSVTFQLKAPFAMGALDLTARLDGQKPCSTSPALLSGRQDRISVVVTCSSNSLALSPHAVTLQAAYTAAGNGCPTSGSLLGQATVLAVQPPAAPALILTANPAQPGCKGAGSVTSATFSYKLTAAADSGPVTLTTPQVAVSSPAVAACTATRQGELLQGTIEVICSATTPLSYDSIDIAVTLTAAAGAASTTASATSTVPLSCCTALGTTAHALPAASPATCLTCGTGGALAGVYQTFDAAGSFSGVMGAAVTPGCSSTTTLGSVSVACDNSRRLAFQVWTPAGSRAALQFLVACTPPRAASACAGTGWKSMATNSNAFDAKSQVVGDKIVTRWVFSLASNTCSCSSATFAVRQAGRFAVPCANSSAAGRLVAAGKRTKAG